MMQRMTSASNISDGHAEVGARGPDFEKPPAVKGVLFDFDGTLTAPGALNFPAIKRRLGCPADMPILEYLDDLPSPERAVLTRVLETEEVRAAASSRPNEGAETCISRLRRMGYRVGILTRNSLKSIHIALGRFQRVRFEDFSAVITREGSLPKPHPDGVRKAAAKMGLMPAQLLAVGDFRFDIMAGHAAGAITVLLVHGNINPMAAGDPAPDYMIGGLEEIPRILVACGQSRMI